MDKNTITGIVLIGLLLFGFTFYQNKQYQKQAAYQAQLDSIALVKQIQADSIAAVEAAQRMSSDTASVAQVAAAPVSIYKDSLLQRRLRSLPWPTTSSRWLSPRKVRSHIQ